MKEVLTKVIESLFNKLPFSKKNEQLKYDLTNNIVDKFEKDKNEDNQIEVVGNLISKCNTIDLACTTANIDEKTYDIDNKKSLNDTKSKKLIKSFKKYLIYESIFIAILFQCFINIICSLNIANVVLNLLISIIIIVILLIIVNKKNKYFEKTNFDNLSYNNKGREYIYNFYDKYSKKFINTLMAFIALFFYIIIFLLLSVLLSRYTFMDVRNQILYLSTISQVLVFFMTKHYLYRKLVSTYFNENKNKQFNKNIINIIKYDFLYFILATIFLIIFRNNIVNIYNWILVFIIIYFILCLSYNLTKRKELMFNNIRFNIKKVVVITLLVITIVGYNFMSLDLFLTQPYINTISNQLEIKDNINYNEENGVYTITTNKENFKILQLTDIHLGGSVVSYTKDLKALQACYKLINETKPDLVIVTGDLVFPMGIMSLSFNNNAPVMQFANFMRNTGIPWAFTYGNHDTEGMATLNVNGFNDLMKSLSFKTSGNLLYPYIQPDIYGRNNQRIEIRNSDGNLMKELYLLDSNDYIKESNKINEYDFIHDDQVQWYKKSVEDISLKEGHLIPSMVFIHIPLKEYKIANELYEKGSEEVKYYYGNLGETMIDKICSSKYDSKLFDTMVELGSTKAVFFGHDHYNNQSLEYKGIRMTYGYSIDYLVMPGIEDDTEQRGGTLITIDNDGSFTITPYQLKNL